MTASNHIIRLLSCAYAGLLCLPASADTLTLTSGDKITGTLTALNDDSSLSIKTPFATEPLTIVGDSIKNIAIDQQSQAHQLHHNRLVLINGDTLPCDITHIDQQAVHINTWYAGEFSIKRELIDRIIVGVDNNQIIHSGIDDVANWENSQSGQWELDDGRYVNADGRGTLSRQFDLPENYILKFRISWQDGISMRMRFSSVQSSIQTNNDNAYELVYNDAGLRLSSISKEHGFSTLLELVEAAPDNLPANHMDVELRVNQSTGAISLYLEDEHIEDCTSALPAPLGKYISFANNKSSSQLNIESISIEAWNGTSRPEQTSKITDRSQDVLVDNIGNVIRCNFDALITENKKTKLTFIQPNEQTKVKAPMEKISALFFKQDDQANAPSPPTSMQAELSGHGHIKLSASSLNDGTLLTTHPLLGPCKINLSAVTSLSNPSKADAQ